MAHTLQTLRKCIRARGCIPASSRTPLPFRIGTPSSARARGLPELVYAVLVPAVTISDLFACCQML